MARALVAAAAAVCDDYGWLIPPLVKQVVDCVLELLLLGQLNLLRNVQLVENRQVVRLGVDDIKCNRRSCCCGVARCLFVGSLNCVKDETRNLGPDSNDTLATDNNADLEGLVCRHCGRNIMAAAMRLD